MMALMPLCFLRVDLALDRIRQMVAVLHQNQQHHLAHLIAQRVLAVHRLVAVLHLRVQVQAAVAARQAAVVAVAMATVAL